MKLSIGIVGLPNVGKSTLFKVLTDIPVNIANYPFCTIDPNVGVVAVPDERLDRLAEISRSQKKIPAVVEFYDIAGLVRGANKGEGLGNQFLAHIRVTHAIVLVLRTFRGNDIVHVEKTVDPLRDMEILETELALKDLETVEKMWKKAEGEAKTGDKAAQKNFEALKAAKAALVAGKPLFTDPKLRNDSNLQSFQLLTAKPQLFLLNGAPEDAPPELITKIKALGAEYVIADLAKEIPPPASTPFTKGSEIPRPSATPFTKGRIEVEEIIRKSYEILNLISFFTTGEDETRAWTIERGAKAPHAAGVIHTDFEKKFIRAEVISWQKLLEAGSWNAAKQKGWLRIEGKEYEVQDGDVMVIRHG